MAIVLVPALSWASASWAQETSPPKLPAQPVPSQSGPVNRAGVPCIQPEPMVKLEDYNGPFEKTIGLFTQQLARKSVSVPHYKPGTVLCSLELKDKFLLFVRGSYDPIIFLNSGFDAGLDQAHDEDHTFGQGMAGYGKRFAADYADQASFRFFKDFAYPTLFGEDPRYYRIGAGNSGKRLFHAIEHGFVAHSDNGNRMFNFSEWLGTASAVSLSNMYHPGNERGFAPSARGVGYNVVEDMGFDVLREFWPEIAHEFRLPFRSNTGIQGTESNPAIQ